MISNMASYSISRGISSQQIGVRCKNALELWRSYASPIQITEMEKKLPPVHMFDSRDCREMKLSFPLCALCT